MRIKKITLKDYKVFREENTIVFPEGFEPVVFIGINGAGKTSILTAIIGGFWEYYHKITRRSRISSTEMFSKSDVNIYGLNDSAEVRLLVENDTEKSMEIGFKLNKVVGKLYNAIGTDEVKDLVGTIRGDVGFYQKQVPIPILVYYPVERTVISPSLKSRPRSDESQFDAYEKALESSIDFDYFFEWFRKREDIENEVRLNDNSTFLDLKLEAVRNAILSFLNGFTRIRVRRIGKLSLVLEKGNEEFEIDQLSHGEKAVISLVGDLARRLVIANQGSINPLEGKGIVLIDELGLHLHPKWQRTILKKLREIFPRIQFICTTHSPLIINHLHSKNVYVLEEGKSSSLKDKFSNFDSYGADVEDVLKVIQGIEDVLPLDVTQSLIEIFELIRMNEINKAKEEIKKLKKITDPNQPEIRKAESQIKYKEIVRR